VSGPTVTASTPFYEGCPAVDAPRFYGDPVHVFRWSTHTCRACGLSLERFDGTAVRFLDGDAPRPEEWERYQGVDSRVMIFRYFGPPVID
jgi:hypothetical protein